MSKGLKAVIIGAGVAGVATAIRLAAQRFEVTVFEKNNYAGGKIALLQQDGFYFDAGPSLFTQPQYIEALFALANEPIEEYFIYKKLTVACKYFYEDGTIINGYTDANAFAKELQNKTGEASENVHGYLASSENLYKNIGEFFLDNSLHKTTSFFKKSLLKAVRHFNLQYLLRSMHSINKTSFSKPQITQLFDRYATYNGSNPYKAPGILTLIPHLEFNEGAFYPKGGMISIANALYKLAVKKGVQFKFNTVVDKILCEKNKATGIIAENKNIYADVVVSNADAYFTYKNLLQDEKKAAAILKQERSSSALIFYWGMNKEFKELELHNIFFSADYKTEFEHLFQLKTLFVDPTIYINITSKEEPYIHAPAGKENWFVMINAPANYGQNWKALQQQAKANIISKLNRILKTNIEAYIETELTANPVNIESDTLSYMGSLYGTSSNTKSAAFLRHPNFSKTIKHLYFAGGSVHPGGGIPLCFKSAKIASDIIATDKLTWKQHT